MWLVNDAHTIRVPFVCLWGRCISGVSAAKATECKCEFVSQFVFLLLLYPCFSRCETIHSTYCTHKHIRAYVRLFHRIDFLISLNKNLGDGFCREDPIHSQSNTPYEDKFEKLNLTTSAEHKYWIAAFYTFFKFARIRKCRRNCLKSRGTIRVPISVDLFLFFCSGLLYTYHGFFHSSKRDQK